MCVHVGFSCCFSTCPKSQLAQINLKCTCICSGPFFMEHVELVRWWAALTEDLLPWMTIWTCRKPQGSDTRSDASLRVLTGDLRSRGTSPASPKDLLALRGCVILTWVLHTHCHSPVPCPSWGWHNPSVTVGLVIISQFCKGRSWSTGRGLLSYLNVSTQIMPHWLFTCVFVGNNGTVAGFRLGCFYK